MPTVRCRCGRNTDYSLSCTRCSSAWRKNKVKEEEDIQEELSEDLVWPEDEKEDD